MKRKYYAYVVSGAQGIVESWEECKKKVHGKEARFKGFNSREEAKRWLTEGAQYEAKPKKPRLLYSISSGVYFDAGTGRGVGVEVSVTDQNGNNLLGKLVSRKRLNKFGKLPLGKEVTNNYGELLGAKYALIFALRNGVKRICGDSRLVVDYWSKGYAKEKDLPKKTIRLIKEVVAFRNEFEKNGGEVAFIPGAKNPADLGFH